jgi:hypothetical protein
MAIKNMEDTEFNFKKREKEKKKSRIKELEEELDRSNLTKFIASVDFITLFLAGGEVILLVIGLLILLGQVPLV